MTFTRVPGFLPSQSGFHFSNSWPLGTTYPVVTLPIVGTIAGGDAGNGLCGGFVLAALDLFCHTPRLLPPPNTELPASGSPIFNYITERLIDSWGEPAQGFNANAARVIEWIQTPGHDVLFSFFGFGLARRVIDLEWPKIKKDIDAGIPSPLSLVMGPERGAADVTGVIASLHHCHQVLAYAYELDNSNNLTLLVYDCNDPFNDNSTLSLNLSNPANTTPIAAPAISAALGGVEVRGFFRVAYTLHDPSAIAFNQSPSVPAASHRMVAGFSPSASGLHFQNFFDHVPLLHINVLGQQIPIGDAANGLCGGMAFTVRDYFEAGIPVPSDTATPASGPLFDYLARRLFDSFNLLKLPPGPVTYMSLMNPDVPDHETDFSKLGLAPHGRAWTMIDGEWPGIKADIDNGRLSPIALISVKSKDPQQMGQNHQVLAYGYDLDGTDLSIRIYDPNFANDDTVTMSLSTANPQHTTPVTYSKSSRTVVCFFRPDYIFSPPPVAIMGQEDWRWCHKCSGLFFSGAQDFIGSCPAGGQHEKGGSGNYTLAHNQPDAVGQAEWRWCDKCSGLFFSGAQDFIGSCPAGGQHEKGGSGNYTLAHNQPDAVGQDEWRWCDKCSGLFFSGGQAFTGSCPAGDRHKKGGSGNYTLIHTPA